MFKSRKNGEGIKGIQGIDELKETKLKQNKSKCNNIFQALSLPTVCNINPRSIYNSLDEFHDFVKEETIDAIFMSESWEREYLTLDKVIKLEGYLVISNVSQRRGIGGRPAIIANNMKYEVQNVTNNLVQIPWGVEAVWCILTPKNVTNDSKIKKIACCSFYCKPGSRKKNLLLDHISDTYNLLSKKFGKGLEFILAGDANDLKIEPILNLSPRFQQIVKDWTRLDPPALLDPIITTLSTKYQVPKCLEPLDPDPDKGGKKSDHRIVVARPISIFNNRSSREIKKVKVRPIPESGVQRMKEWFIEQTWEHVYQAESAHAKAAILQKTLLDVLEDIFPETTRKISSDDQPWVTHKLKVLDRKRKRVYHKQRRSERWKNLDKLFKKEMKIAKSKFYTETIEDLKNKKPGQWYSCLKKIASSDPKLDQVNIDELSHFSDQIQSEIIADKFSAIPNQYDALEKDDISIPQFSAEDVPQFDAARVWLLLSKINTNKATVPGDFPPKLIKIFAAYLAEPLTDVINTSIRRGEYPDIYKFEISTPVPKNHPPETTSDMRNISGLLTFDKIFESLLSELIISDMKPNLDPAQYGNQPGISIQHYLINMIHRILTAVDKSTKSETFAVIASLIDWDNAYPRQCRKLGIESFMRNGVRLALIPVLINYFQDRKMSVKWRGCRSLPRILKRGGPQGATMGLLEFLSQSNDCADGVSESERRKVLVSSSLSVKLSV